MPPLPRHYGSDHRATYLNGPFGQNRTPDRKPRRAYERAEWDKIGQTVQAALEPLPIIGSEEELEQAVNISKAGGDLQSPAPVRFEPLLSSSD
jgi:hypothetical protein